jgi:hypothetical protein
MRITAHRNWNRTFGIDPDVPIAERDRKDIEAYFSIDDGGRCHAGDVHPKSVQILPALPATVVFGLGGVAVVFHWIPPWSMAIVMAVALLLFLRGCAWYARAHLGTLYRRELRERGYDICVNCGYWLRGLGHEVTCCPECGAARDRASLQSRQ